MKLVFLPRAEADMREASLHYSNEANLEVAARFNQELKRVTALLSAQPGLGHVMEAMRPQGAARGFGLKHFPYTVVYQTTSDTLLVLAVAHHRRRPGYWQKG